ALEDAINIPGSKPTLLGHVRTIRNEPTIGHIVAVRVHGRKPKPRGQRDDCYAMTTRIAGRRQDHAAARLDKKSPSAFFPCWAASAMLSKRTDERSTGADLPAQ